MSEKFDANKLRSLIRAAHPAPWFHSVFIPDDDMECATVGPFEGEHIEDTIAEFWGGNYNALKNAELVAYLVTHAEFLLAAALTVSKPKKVKPEEAVKRLLGDPSVYELYEPGTLQQDAKIVARAYDKIKKT